MQIVETPTETKIRYSPDEILNISLVVYFVLAIACSVIIGISVKPMLGVATGIAFLAMFTLSAATIIALNKE